MIRTTKTSHVRSEEQGKCGAVACTPPNFTIVSALQQSIFFITTCSAAFSLKRSSIVQLHLIILNTLDTKEHHAGTKVVRS